MSVRGSVAGFAGAVSSAGDSSILASWRRDARRPSRLRLPKHVVTVDLRRGAMPVLPVAALPGVASFRGETGGSVPRLPATVVDAPPALAAEMAAQGSVPVAPPQARVAILFHAVVRDGVIETADGAVARESLINRDPAMSASPLRGVSIMRRLRDRPYVLLKQRWDANYGHWLIEGLPRLALVEDRYSLGDLGFIVSAHHGPAMGKVYEDSLALFGIRRDQIVEVGTEPIAVDRLIYPTPMTRHPWHIAPRCVSLLEQVAARIPADPGGHERIYVSRNRSQQRRLVNEDEILAIVRRLGFVVVAPECLSLYRQIGLFRDARVVIGSYGAALTNVAFAANQPALLALTSQYMQDDFFSTLMSLKQGRYFSLHGEALDASNGMNSDFRIDVPRFRALLDEVLRGEMRDAR